MYQDHFSVVFFSYTLSLFSAGFPHKLWLAVVSIRTRIRFSFFGRVPSFLIFGRSGNVTKEHYYQYFMVFIVYIYLKLEKKCVFLWFFINSLKNNFISIWTSSLHHRVLASPLCHIKLIHMNIIHFFSSYSLSFIKYTDEKRVHLI